MEKWESAFLISVTTRTLTFWKATTANIIPSFLTKQAIGESWAESCGGFPPLLDTRPSGVQVDRSPAGTIRSAHSLAPVAAASIAARSHFDEAEVFTSKKGSEKRNFCNAP